MAHQFSSPSSGSSSAHQGSGLSSAPMTAHQTSLDLNLSQKASQNPFKGGHDETASLLHKAFEASTTSQLDTGLKALEVLTSNANGCLHPLQRQDADPVTASPRAGLNGTLVTAADDGLPVASESASNPAGQKRRSPRVEAASSAQKELLQGGTVAPVEDDSLLINGPMPTSSGLKRKSPRVKQTTSDSTKKVILALEANDDEGSARPRGRPRGNSDMSKDRILDTPRSRSKSLAAKGGTPDLAERRLLLEERKIRLAEQRYLLEEKKLDATIEIGKGLIISMERMTNTISQLGDTSRGHR